jgi:hypothetical protein
MPGISDRARSKRYLILAATGVAAAAAAVSTTAFAAEPIQWTTTSTPDNDVNYAFAGVDALTDDDVWAVGYTIENSWNGTYAAHWDGKAWQHTETPAGLTLQDVSGVATDDVWAVGITDKGSLTTHWDGSAWQPVDSPQPQLPAGQTARLKAVDAVATDNVWAVGCGSSDGEQESTAIAQHWDGKQWQLSEIQLPEGTENSCLDDVVYRAADEIWAVGRMADADGGAPLTLRYDGEAWIVVETPDLGQSDGRLTSVVSPALGRGAGGVWAAGFTSEFGDPTTGKPALLEWDGKAWTQVKTPDVRAWIYGMSHDGAGGLLLTGYGSRVEGLVLRYDGTTVTSEAGPIDTESALYAADSADDSAVAWVVGGDGAVDGTMKGLAAHTG